MICDEVAEYVSAICDGERIPTAAAEHIGNCETCGERLRDYAAIGIELRRVASLEVAADVPPRKWKRSKGVFGNFWQKGWGAMRIPRFAFALLVAAVAVLTSTLAVVKVRAHDSGIVVLLTVAAGNDKPHECPLSTIDKRNSCAYLGDFERNILGWKIDLIKREGDRVQLGVRTRVWPKGTDGVSSYSLDGEPQQQLWFEPGDTLTVDVPEASPLTIKGNWLDHMPEIAGMHDLDPAAGELRVISPLLLHGKDVVADMEGTQVIENQHNYAAWFYFPKQGSYLISLVPLKGGIKAKVDLNRISFKESGEPYVFVTGTPVTRSPNVWVLHQADFDPSQMGPNLWQGFSSSRALTETSSGEWVPAALPN